MQTFLLGMNAKIYQGAEGSQLAELIELSNVRDVTLNLEAGEADVTTRANQGWRATAPTLRECTIEFEMLWKPGDAGFQAVKTAFLTAGLLRFAVLTGAREAEGSEGPVGDFSITNFSRSEPLEEGVTVSVTAKLAVFVEWFGAGDQDWIILPSFNCVLTDGVGQLDLTAIPYNAGTFDATGRLVSALKVVNTGANTLTITEGIADGYNLFALGQPVVVPAGGTANLAAASGGAVGAAAKILALTGTGAQTSTWTITLEDVA